MSSWYDIEEGATVIHDDGRVIGEVEELRELRRDVTPARERDGDRRRTVDEWLRRAVIDTRDGVELDYEQYQRFTPDPQLTVHWEEREVWRIYLVNCGSGCGRVLLDAVDQSMGRHATNLPVDCAFCDDDREVIRSVDDDDDEGDDEGDDDEPSNDTDGEGQMRIDDYGGTRLMTDGGRDTGSDDMSESTDNHDGDVLDFTGIDEELGEVVNGDEGGDDESVEMPDIDDDPRYGSDEDRRVELSDGTLVGRRKGRPDEGDVTYQCVECHYTTESEQGVKTHYGAKHKDDDGEDDEPVNDGSDGATTGLMSGSQSPSPSGEVDCSDDGEGMPEEWATAAQRYIEKSDQSHPTRSEDARQAAVDALEAETEWMCIVERSDAGNSYDLWRWSDEDGWCDDGMMHLSNVATAYLGADMSDTEINHVASLLARYNLVPQDETNADHLDETLIPVSNGVICVDDIEYDADSISIDWESVELRDKDPEHRFLYQIGTEWDPDAADLDGLDEWLETITRNDEERRIIWEFGGHSCHPRYPADGFLTALGRGGSGKSQTLEVIKAMLGDDNVAVQKLQKINTGRFTGKTVVDKRANINTELSGTKISNIDKLKVYSAGEEDMVEGKGTPFYKAENDATMMFASDNPPAIDEDNRALGRRLYPVEFPCVYVDDPNPDNPFELQSRPKPEVQDELQSDARLKAALMRAVEGLKRLLEEGNFTSSKSWEERVEQYESFSDPVRDFVRSALVADSASVIESGDLEMTFDAFADDRDHDGKKLQQIWSVIEEMPDYPSSKTRPRGFSNDQARHTVYEGISFNEVARENWVPDAAYWEHYGGRPESRVDDDEEAGPRRLRVAELSLGREQDRGVKVEVSHSSTETKPWLADEGVLRDDTGTVRYESRDEIQLKEGETYVLEDIRVVAGENESDLVVDLVAGMTDVMHIDTDGDDGVDNDDDGDEPSNDDDGSSDDGGEELRRTVKNTIEERKIRDSDVSATGMSESALIGTIADRHGASPSDIKTVLDELRDDGELCEVVAESDRVDTVSTAGAD